MRKAAFYQKSVFLAAHQSNHNGLLCVQAVFCFIENFVCVLLEHLGGDLLLTVGRQAVLHHAARLCSSQQLIIDLIALECLHADFLLGFLTHGRPCISDNNVCVLSSLHRVISDEEVRVRLCECHNLSVRTVVRRRCDGNLHAGLEAAELTELDRNAEAVAEAAEEGVFDDVPFTDDELAELAMAAADENAEGEPEPEPEPAPEPEKKSFWKRLFE